MSKNKFFKKLLVAGLCALTATATVGTVVTVAGCKKEDEKKEQTQEYTVTFDLDGGTWSNANSVKVKDGEKVNKPSNPTKTGYTFVKWVDKSDSTEYDFNTVVDGDLTLKAIWQVAQSGGETTKYTVTIDLDGGTWGDNSLSIEVEKDGTLGDALAGVTALPTKTGHEFKGWITTSGDAYDTDTAVTADITIKASWQAVHQHTWATEWTKDVNGHHKKAICNDNATCETAKDQEGAHVDANGDNKCDTCEYEETNLPAGYTALKDKIGTDRYEAVFNNTFIVAGTLPQSSSWNTKGLYTSHNSTGKDDANYSSVSGGKVAMTDGGDGETHFNVALGNLTGIVEGYFDISFRNGGNSWTPVQIHGTSSSKENAEILGLRTNSGNDKLMLRENGTEKSQATDLASSATASFGVHFVINLETGAAKLDLTAAGSDSSVTYYDDDLGVSKLLGIRFTSSNSGAKLVDVDNLIIINQPVEVSAYKTSILADLLAAYNAYDVTNKYTTNGAALTAAYDAAVATINSEETNTIALVYDAYNAGIAAMKAVKSDLALYKEEKIEDLIGYKNNKDATDYSDAGKAALETAVTDGTAEINKATDNAGVDAALQAAKDAVDEVPTLSGEAVLNNRDDITISTLTPDTEHAKTDDYMSTKPSASVNLSVSEADPKPPILDNGLLTLVATNGTDSKHHASGYLTMKADCAVEFTSTTPNAVITVVYNGTSSGRHFELTDSAGTLIGDGNNGLGKGKYEANAATDTVGGKKALIITLGAAGTYTMTMKGGEHKIQAFTLTENLVTNTTAKVDSLSATVAETATVGDTIASLVTEVTVKADVDGEKSDETITAYTVIVKKDGVAVEGTTLDDAGEYTVLIINGTGKTEANATQYNSHSYTVTVS